MTTSTPTLTPAVLPNQPVAPGASSRPQVSRAARTSDGSLTFPLITCTNMSRSFLGQA